MTTQHDNYEIAAKKIITQVGKTIVIGVALGIGKPIGLLNALYRLAGEDSSIHLTIITGLTLARPILRNELEKRLVEPILDRTLKDYEDPLYEKARELQQLPKNINVIEFFLAPGKYLHNSYVQQNYISSSYTAVVRDTLYYSINVIAQQVAPAKSNPEEYSLSCNTDLFHAVTKHLNEAKLAGKKIAIVAEVNANLPFMYGDAIVNADTFTDIVDTGHYRALFSIPRESLAAQDHLIGLYTSCLIQDGGCLQIGIGKLSIAVANALILRHKQNAAYQNLINHFSVKEKFGETISSLGALAPFNQGLYASTEMLSDEYIELYKEGILKKRVYDHVGLQQLLNSHKITEAVTAKTLEVLLENNIINSKLTLSDFQFLQHFGILKSGISYQSEDFILPSGEKIPADLTSEKSRQTIIDKCLGKNLKSGKIAHAGFFLGSIDLYRQLHNLSPTELQLIDMTSVARTNSLSWFPELLKLQRQQARLINSTMMVTLSGVIISDGLKDWREISGVGGQFNFVNMAQELPQARSIINCRSTRKTKRGVESNIIWEYPNITIPRYLRDIVVTEYGIADCRSKTDSNVIQSILNITDSRFQEKLLKQAKKSGKIPQDYQIPAQFRQNYPDKLEPIMYLKEHCKPYPFGSDLTQEEEIIKNALLFLKNCSKLKLIFVAFASLFFFSSDNKFNKYLLRMKLQHPKNIKDYFYKKLLKFVIKSYL